MMRHVVSPALLAAVFLAAGCGAAQTLPMAAPMASPGTGAARPLLPPRHGPPPAELRRAVESFPELTGAAREGVNVLAVVLRADGGIEDSRLRLADSRPDQVRAEGEFQQWLPIADGDGRSRVQFPQGASVAGSASLATDLIILSTRLPADFNPQRATRRVSNLMRETRAELFLPGASGQINRLMVLLADDGTVIKEDVQRFRRDDIRPGPRDADHQQSFARMIAETLQVDMDQLGVVGAGTPSMDGKALFVVHAWQRAPGEPGPRLYGVPPPPPAFDTELARMLVERHLPDAFGDIGAQTPAILLTAEGVVLRVGRVPLREGGMTTEALQSPVLAGVHIGEVTVEPVRNAAGDTRDVLFVWEAGTQALAPGVRP